MRRLVNFLKNFGGDLSHSHFQVTYFLYDDVFSFFLLGKNSVVELGHQTPHDVHRSDTGLEVVVISEVEDFVD